MSCDACSFRRLANRMAIVQYVLTGELIPAPNESESDTIKQTKSRSTRKKHETGASVTKSLPKVMRAPADCGSLVFGPVPPNSAPLERDVFFNTISLETVLEHLDSRRNIVDTMISIKLHQLQMLRQDLVNGRVTIELQYATMDEDNESLIQFLSSLEPHSVSWLNLVDYANLEEFHRTLHGVSTQIATSDTP